MTIPAHENHDAGQADPADPAGRHDAMQDKDRAGSPWSSAAQGIAAASAPEATPQVMMQAAVDRPTVRLALSGNPAATPEALLAALSEVEARRSARSWVARETLRALASHPRLPADQLRRLNLDYAGDIGASVGSNPAAPPDLLDAVVARHGISGAAGIAANPALDPSRLARLSRDAAPIVRLAAAGNPRLAGNDLARLAGDPSSLVRATAAARLARRPWSVVRAALQVNGEGTRERIITRLTSHQAQRLAADQDRWLRAALARYATHAETLTELAADPDPLVRRRATRRLLALLNPPRPASRRS